MTEPYLAMLNPEQRQAVEHSGDQPPFIIAKVGSGKTNTLARRVAHLMVQRTYPPFQPRGVLVNIGGDDDWLEGGAGDSTNVSQTFQPSGLLSWSNSP